jgi:predicted nucleic acid-binding protein
MNGFLLDTNIPSEMTRPRPQPSVSAWLDDADDDRLYFSVVSLGEILKGVTLLSESKRRRPLQTWLDETLRPWIEGRILPVNQSGTRSHRRDTECERSYRSWRHGLQSLGRCMIPQ